VDKSKNINHKSRQNITVLHTKIMMACLGAILNGNKEISRRFNDTLVSKFFNNFTNPNLAVNLSLIDIIVIVTKKLKPKIFSFY